MRGAAVAGSWVLFLATWPAVVVAGSLQVVRDVPDTAADPPQAVDTPPDSVLAARLVAVYASFEEFDSGEKLFAVPWKALVLVQDEEHFLLDVDKEVLADGPGPGGRDLRDLRHAYCPYQST